MDAGFGTAGIWNGRQRLPHDAGVGSEVAMRYLKAIALALAVMLLYVALWWLITRMER